MGSFWWGSVLLGITRSFWWGFDCLVPLIAILVETQRFVLLIAVLPGTSPTVLMGTAQTRIHLKAVLLGNAFNCSDGNNWFLCHSAGSVLMGILRFRWRSDGAFRERLRIQCILPSISRFCLRQAVYRLLHYKQNLHVNSLAVKGIRHILDLPVTHPLPPFSPPTIYRHACKRSTRYRRLRSGCWRIVRVLFCDQDATTGLM